jgi:hypothetical protein
MSNGGDGPITIGRITLEPHDSDDVGGPGSLWGLHPGTGDAVFIVHEATTLDAATPWSAALWVGWEDGGSAPNDLGTPRYADRDAAIDAVRRMVGAR